MQANTLYYKGVAPDLWTAIEYDEGGTYTNAGAWLQAGIDALPSRGGTIYVGPSTGFYNFTAGNSALVNTNNVKIICDPGAIFNIAQGEEDVTVCVNVQKDRFVWEGGQFQDVSDAASGGGVAGRAFILVQNAAAYAGKNAHISGVTFTMANRDSGGDHVALGGRGSAIRFLNSDESVYWIEGGSVHDNVFIFDSGQEATSYHTDGATPMGWVGIRMEGNRNAHIYHNTFRGQAALTGSPATVQLTGDAAGGRGRGKAIWLDNSIYTTISGNRFYGFSSEPVDATINGIFEITRTGTAAGEGHHNEIIGNTWHDTLGGWHLLIRGGDYSTITGNNWGRVSAAESGYTEPTGALGLFAYPDGSRGGGITVTGNQFHNVNGLADNPHTGVGLGLLDVDDVYASANHHSLVNRASGDGDPRYPYWIGKNSGSNKEIRIGDFHITYNGTSPTPFYPVYFEDRAVRSRVRVSRPPIDFSR